MRYSYAPFAVLFLAFHAAVWACFPVMMIDVTPNNPYPAVGQNVTLTAICDSSPVQEYLWVLPTQAYHVQGKEHVK